MSGVASNLSAIKRWFTTYWSGVAIAILIGLGTALLIRFAPGNEWKIWVLAVLTAFALAWWLHPKRWLRRMAISCMAAGAAGGFAFKGHAVHMLGIGSGAGFAIDSSPLSIAAGIVGACFFAWLDAHKHGIFAPPLPLAEAPPSPTATSTGSGTAIAAPVAINGNNNFSPGISDPTLSKLLDKIPDASQGSAQAASESKPSLANLPPVSPTFIPRQNITREIHEALNAPGHTSALRQAAARAYGGFGKTVAAILYGHEYAECYPGGRFFLSMEKADPVTALASLRRYFNVPEEAKPEAAAARVKAGLEGVPGADGERTASLLILDNIVDVAQWDVLTKCKIPGTDESLLPRGGCRLLITTRAESIPQAKTVRIVGLTKEEARDVYKKFCADADVRGGNGRQPPSDEAADTITKLVGGLAVAVAAVAARMKLAPAVAWADYAQKLATLPIESLPDASEEVRREIGANGEALAEHRCTLRIIDDCLDSLPAPERRVLEYAALLPEDMAPTPWLIALLEADTARPATTADGTPDPLALTLVQDPDLPDSPALRVLRHLDTLDLLLEAGESGKLLSLHRLWYTRVNEKASASSRYRAVLLDAIEALVYHLEEQWVGPAIASVQWSEVISLHALSKMLPALGRTTAGTAARSAVRRVVPSLPSPPAAIQAQAVAVAEALGWQVE